MVAAIFIPISFFDRLTLALAWMIFIVLGIALSFYDLKCHRLPNKLNTALYFSGFTSLSIDAILHDRLNRLQDAVFASIVLGALFLIASLLSKGGMGMGDVKLALSIGLYTGYTSAISVYVAAMISFAIGSVFGIAIMFFGRGTKKTAIPFGPFMLAGALISIWITPHIGFN